MVDEWVNRNRKYITWTIRSVSPAGRHDDLHVVQEDRTAELKLHTERHLDRKRAGRFQSKTQLQILSFTPPALVTSYFTDPWLFIYLFIYYNEVIFQWSHRLVAASQMFFCCFSFESFEHICNNVEVWTQQTSWSRPSDCFHQTIRQPADKNQQMIQKEKSN